MHIYAELKGLSPGTRAQECHALIVAVGLGNKLNARSKSLSGGMKRKLSLAIALMGDDTKVRQLAEAFCQGLMLLAMCVYMRVCAPRWYCWTSPQAEWIRGAGAARGTS